MEESDKLANSEHRVTSQITTKEANKVALGALVGNAIEWYDFFLFSAAAALVFNVQYFATDSATDSAMAAFATFGVGLVARPVGGAIFGAIGDRVGRKNVLLITVIGVGIVTALIGMLPTYAAIGVAAPILLILLRILQGLFVGGEWSGAMTIVVENAPLKRRALYAAIPQIGSPIGTIMSSGFFFIMGVMLTQDSFDAWGWRVPFLFAIPLVLVGAWLRSKLEESPVFEALKEEGEVEKAPFIAIFKNNWLQIIIGVLVAVVGVAGFYLVTSFVVWYGVNILGYIQDLMLIGTFVGCCSRDPRALLRRATRRQDRCEPRRDLRRHPVGLGVDSGLPADHLGGADARHPRHDAGSRRRLGAVRRIRNRHDRPLPRQDPLLGCRVGAEHRGHDRRLRAARGNRMGGRGWQPVVAGSCDSVHPLGSDRRRRASGAEGERGDSGLQALTCGARDEILAGAQMLEDSSIWARSRQYAASAQEQADARLQAKPAAHRQAAQAECEDGPTGGSQWGRPLF